MELSEDKDCSGPSQRRCCHRRYPPLHSPFLCRDRITQLPFDPALSTQGFQEALIRQVRDLAELLGDDWAWVSVLTGKPFSRRKKKLKTEQAGVGRDDGASKGEFNPIFYRKSVTFGTQ